VQIQQLNAEMRAERTRQTLQIAELDAPMAQLDERLAEGPSDRADRALARPGKTGADAGAARPSRGASR
jgi:hypothetical protein